MPKEKTQTYDYVCFTDLVYELGMLDKKKTEQKIKRRLKYYGLGTYNQERVDCLRKLKDDLCSEISRGTKSHYFHKTTSTYSELADFDIQGMMIDYANGYPLINKNDMFAMINFAICWYHLR